MEGRLTRAGLEVIVDEEPFRALADKGFFRVQAQLLTAMVLLGTVVHACIGHKHRETIKGLTHGLLTKAFWQ